MTRVIDLTGKRFGARIVLGLHPVRKSGRVYWTFLCDCGNRGIALGQALKRGKKCEKCTYKGDRPYRRLRPYEAQYNIFVGRARYPVSITYEQFFELTKIHNCHYCNRPIIWQEWRHQQHKGGSGSNLDRCDNAKPYSIDNVVVCCQRCNYGKNKYFSYKEWVVMTRALVQMELDLEK